MATTEEEIPKPAPEKLDSTAKDDQIESSEPTTSELTTSEPAEEQEPKEEKLEPKEADQESKEAEQDLKAAEQEPNEAGQEPKEKELATEKKKEEDKAEEKKEEEKDEGDKDSSEKKKEEDKAEGKEGEKEEGDKDSSKKTDKFTYRDFSHIQPTPTHTGPMSPNSTAIRVQKLPAKLNAMLSNPEYQHIISWMPHGRSWKVHNPHAFVEEVVPKYFEYTNYNSFVRLVNAWGFRRITKGPDRNSYYHELFLRAMPHLHGKMHRLTASEKKLPLDPEDEPDLYKISALCPLPPATPNPVVGMGKGMPRGPPRNPLQFQKQMMAKQFQGGPMGGLGNPNAFMAGAGMLNYPDIASARMAGVNPMAMQAAAAAQLEEEEMAMAAGMGGAGMGGGAGGMGGTQGGGAGGFGPMGNNTLQQQRAELIAANQAYEVQLQRLKEQERRLLIAQANTPGGAAGAAGMPYGGGGAGAMGRMGRGGGMMAAGAPGMGGLTQEGMLSGMGGGDASGMGPMSPAMMARLQQQSQMPPGGGSFNQMKRGF